MNKTSPKVQISDANKRNYGNDDDVKVVGRDLPHAPNWINLHKFSLLVPAYCTLYPCVEEG